VVITQRILDEYTLRVNIETVTNIVKGSDIRQIKIRSLLSIVNIEDFGPVTLIQVIVKDVFSIYKTICLTTMQPSQGVPVHTEQQIRKDLHESAPLNSDL